MSQVTKTTFPSLYLGQWVDEHGYLTPEAASWFTQFVVAAQYNISSEGVRLPNILSTQASSLTVPGAMVYASDTDKALVNIAGTMKQIQYI